MVIYCFIRKRKVVLSLNMFLFHLDYFIIIIIIIIILIL